jgi:uncharacterized protein (UPF0210 family)
LQTAYKEVLHLCVSSSSIDSEKEWYGGVADDEIYPKRMSKPIPAVALSQADRTVVSGIQIMLGAWKFIRVLLCPVMSSLSKQGRTKGAWCTIRSLSHGTAKQSSA